MTSEVARRAIAFVDAVFAEKNPERRREIISEFLDSLTANEQRRFHEIVKYCVGAWHKIGRYVT